MAIEKSVHDPRLSLNIQHEYITLRMPNGSFTYGFSRIKATGGVGEESFDRLIGFMEEGTGNPLSKMKELLQPEILGSLCPEWSLSPSEHGFKKGDRVIVDDPLVLREYGTTRAVVEKVGRVNLVLQFPDGRLKVPPSMVKPA